MSMFYRPITTVCYISFNPVENSLRIALDATGFEKQGSGEKEAGHVSSNIEGYHSG